MGQHMCFSQSLFYTWRIKGRRNFGTMQNRPTFKCFHFPTEWKSSHPSSSNTVTLHSPILCGTWQSCTSRCLQWCTRIHVCPQQNGFTGLQGVTLICLYTVGNLLHWQPYSRTTCRNCLWESWSFWGFRVLQVFPQSPASGGNSARKSDLKQASHLASSWKKEKWLLRDPLGHLLHMSL